MRNKDARLFGIIVEAVLSTVEKEWPESLPVQADPGCDLVDSTLGRAFHLGMEEKLVYPFDFFKTYDDFAAEKLMTELREAENEGSHLVVDGVVLEDAMRHYQAFRDFPALLTGFAGGLRSAGLSREEMKRRLEDFLANFTGKNQNGLEDRGTPTAAA